MTGEGADVEESRERIEDVVARLREARVTQLRVIFLDYNGIARARSLSIDSLGNALERGVNFSSPTVEFNSRDLFPASAAFDLASPDFWAKPDASTYRPVPGHPETGQMLADLVDAQGVPWKGCPRAALYRLVRRGEERGICFNVGFEPEFYVLRRSGSGVGFVGPPEFATLDGLDLESELMSGLLEALRVVGLTVEQWSEEYGPGQIEINLRYASPLDAADGLVFFKQTVRSVARTHGLHATFMPKPFGDQAGSGMHVHLSASPNDDPSRNLFDDPSDPELGLSALGRHALAGLMDHAAALTALGASTVNSYKRFLPGSWAPTHLAYAYASRAAFVRVPERETPRRLELRVGDAACNPYLYLTAILAAMLDGIEREIEPCSPQPGDLGKLSADEAVGRGIEPVPATLGEALNRLEADAVLCDALDPLIAGEYLKVKRSEWEDFCRHVGEWDRVWYLDRY